MDRSERENVLLDLFMSAGWKLVIEEMTEARDLLVNTTHALETERQLWYRKGEIQKLSELIAFERINRLQWQEEADDGDAL